MIPRFDGASFGAGFSTSRVTRWSRPWSSGIVGRLAGDDAVAARLLGRDLHDGHDRAVGLVVRVDELADDRPLADAHVVRQDDRERLVADQVLRHEHRVPQAELLLLADVGQLGQVADRPHLAELLDLALLLEQVLELVVEVEVVLDRALVGRGDDDDLLDPGGHRLLDAVLDDRLVDQRQHLFGLRLGRGQEAGAPAGGGENGFTDAHRTSVGRVSGDAG